MAAPASAPGDVVAAQRLGETEAEQGGAIVDGAGQGGGFARIHRLGKKGEPGRESPPVARVVEEEGGGRGARGARFGRAISFERFSFLFRDCDLWLEGLGGTGGGWGSLYRIFSRNFEENSSNFSLSLLERADRCVGRLLFEFLADTLGGLLW